MISPLYEIASYTSVFAGVMTTLATLIAAYGALRRNRAETAPKGAGLDPAEIETIRAEIATAKPGTPIPFEIEQLASYYALTLGQARVSFWFSLIFAAIGFVVIIAGAAFSAGGELTTAALKVGSGLIVDAISALFFIQSRRAQESMSAFFEKLRNDRQFVEARRICDDITNTVLKNHLKTILVLQYSGLDASTITAALTTTISDKSESTKTAETHVLSTPEETKVVAENLHQSDETKAGVADVRSEPDNTKVPA